MRNTELQVGCGRTAKHKVARERTVHKRVPE